MEFSNAYIFRFAAMICLVCSLLVSSVAVSLKDLQTENELHDKKTNVVKVAGLVKADSKPTKEEVNELFEEIDTLWIDRASGKILERKKGFDDSYDPLAAVKELAGNTEEETSWIVCPDPKLAKNTSVKRMPKKLLAYHVKTKGEECFIVGIKGYGLWSTLLGFMAIETDGQTIKGITFYSHGETPGLGGEVDNPKWKGQWPGKKIFGEDGLVKLTVKKGAGSVGNFEVDGLSGATFTGDGVKYMVQLWLCEHGYGSFLKSLQEASKKGGSDG